MYLEEEKSTAIAYRLINENLPTFVDNLKIYNKLLKFIPEIIEKIHIEDIIKLCKRNIGNKYLTPNKNVKVFVNKGKIIISHTY